jgi:uncharacterized membrane protein YgcG
LQKIIVDREFVKPTQYSRAARARDDGLRRIKKVTWRIGLVAGAAAAIMAAKFAHFTPSLPHLSVSDSPSSGGSSSSGGSAGTSSSSGIPPSSGVSSPGGSSAGGVTTSGGS